MVFYMVGVLKPGFSMLCRAAHVLGLDGPQQGLNRMVVHVVCVLRPVGASSRPGLVVIGRAYLPLRSVGFRACGTQARGLNVARAGLNGPQQGPKRLVCHTVPILRPAGAASLGAGGEARRAALDVARAGLDGIAHAGRGRWAST